jgi:hypothetical protein
VDTEPVARVGRGAQLAWLDHERGRARGGSLVGRA